MKKYYLRNDSPICLKGKPEPEDIEISEQEYKRICKERNEKIAEDQIIQEEEMKPILERNSKIRERMRKIAEDQLIAEGEIDEVEETLRHYDENEMI